MTARFGRRALGARVGSAALLGVAGSLAGGAGKPVLAAVPIDRLDQNWWRERHEAVLARLRQDRVDLLLLGDSITQDWELDGPEPERDFREDWKRFYGGRNAVNLGFNGDTTANLLWRVENGEVAGVAPRAAVVLIGANNFGHLHWSAEDTVTGIGAVLDALRARLPKTRVLLLGVLPCDRGPWVEEQTVRCNALLASRYRAAGSGVTFMDVGHLLRRDGVVDRSLFYDPLEMPPRPSLHPSAEGQRRIAAAIEPTLAAMLGDAPRA